MTGISRGTRHPLRLPRNSAVISGIDPAARPGEPSQVSERILDSVIQVEDPDRVLEFAQAQRRIQFQYLIRRYICQILYGCKNPSCTTPTCLSCKKRLTSKPFRVPTQLTARALAHFLASQDDPYNNLCPSPLKVSPSELEINGSHDSGILKETSKGFLRKGERDERVHSGNLIGSSSENTVPSHAATQHDVSRECTPSHSRATATANDFWQSINKRHQTKKDIKSLGQNLFDTVTVIYSYSRHIPTPFQIYHALCQSDSGGLSKEDDDESCTNHVRDVGENQAGISRSNKTSTDELPQVNGHAKSPHVKSPTPPKTDAQHSPPFDHSTLRPKKSQKQPSTHVYSEVLSNGQRIQLRKIKQRLPQQHLANGQISSKLEALSGLDGTEDRRRSPMLAADKRPPPLDLRGPRKNGPTLFSPTTAKRDDYQNGEKGEDVVLPVTSHLSCAIMDELAKHTHSHRDDQSSGFSFVVDYDKHFRFRPTKPFVNRSLYYTLSDPKTLLESFREEEWNEGKDSPLPHLNAHRLTQAFRLWNQRNGSLIFDSLWRAAESLFDPPPELDNQKSPRLKAARKSPDLKHSESKSAPCATPKRASTGYLSDLDAAHIIMICIHALASLVPTGWPYTWAQVRKFRSWGRILPGAPKETSDIASYTHPWLNIIDELEYEPALRLAKRVVRGIAARRCFSEVLRTLSSQANDHGEALPLSFNLMDILVEHLAVVEEQALIARKRFNSNLNIDQDPGWTVSSVFMEWLRTIVIKEWDGKAEINRWTAVGGAVDILADLYEHREALHLYKNMFYTPYLNERLDNICTPNEFLDRSNSYPSNPNTLHLLSHPHLFYPRHLVTYFRTVNYSNMYKQYELSQRNAHMRRQLGAYMDERHWWMITQRMKETLADYLVLDVSRDHPLQDAFDQLWGLQRRQLLKPLKVKMGAREGEVGVDQGGVSLEFFRVILAEVFNADIGMFSIDPQTRMTWFQPCSLEPLHRFELVGILFSLAIYNGVTLPVTFPLAFYRRLLDKPVTSIGHIRDGWPELARAFEQLLSWSNGDVGDIFTRTYSFSFEALGQRKDVNMEAIAREDPWPLETPSPNETLQRPSSVASESETSQSSMEVGKLNDPILDWMISNDIPSSPGSEHDNEITPDLDSEETLVTNENRERYVDDYIFWLTDKSIRPQFEAFRKGFFSCLHKTALQLFNPEALQTLVEGHQEIDIKELKKAVRYEDGYSPSHPTIAYFWSIVGKFTLTEKKQLLEFVTASDRVPVNGLISIQFCIVRSTSDTELLPTSSTCFGKLMLPEYSSREKLERKLRLALQNSKGFGAV